MFEGVDFGAILQMILDWFASIDTGFDLMGFLEPVLYYFRLLTTPTEVLT